MSSYMNEYQKHLEDAMRDKISEGKYLPSQQTNFLGETVSSTTETSVDHKDNEIETDLLIGIVGFFLGVLITFVFLNQKIKSIKASYEVRIDEARKSLDRMLEIASKQEKQI